MKGHTFFVDSLAVTPDGRKVISGSSDGTARVWDLPAGECRHVLEGHAHRVSAVSATPDGTRAASASHDGTIRVWRLEDGACVTALAGHTSFVNALAATADARRVVSGGHDGTLRVWDLAMESEIACFATGHEVLACAVDHRGRVVAGLKGGGVCLLEIENVAAGPTVVTAWQEAGSPRRGRRRPVAFGCPCCRQWLHVPRSALGSQTACPGCGEVIKLNAFTLCGDWRPVAEAWQSGS
jgi:WD40 repeat protein